jgi:hypothetical protein
MMIPIPSMEFGSIKLGYIAGGVLDFLCSSQVAEKHKVVMGFLCPCQRNVDQWNLRGFVATLGGYYAEPEDPGSSEYNAGTQHHWPLDSTVLVPSRSPPSLRRPLGESPSQKGLSSLLFYTISYFLYFSVYSFE